MNDIHKLSGAYALDAVDEFERAQFERHLNECGDCRTETTSLQETAALLSETTAVTPPPGLRTSVLAGIAQVRPIPPVRPVTTHRRRWLPLLVAASLLAALGAGAALWQPWAPSQQVSLTAAEQVLSAQDAKSVAVDLGAAGRATVTRSKSMGLAVITTNDMAPAPSGKVFAIWLQNDEGAMLPAGLMPSGENNQLVLDGDAAAATAAGITIEPEGGSPKPTAEPIALFDFSKAT